MKKKIKIAALAALIYFWGSLIFYTFIMTIMLIPGAQQEDLPITIGYAMVFIILGGGFLYAILKTKLLDKLQLSK